MHVHVGFLEFVAFACYAIIFGFLWRTLSVKMVDKPVGKAMAYIHG